MERVLIRKMKRSGGLGIWGAYVVDRDDHGIWLYSPTGSLFEGTTPAGEVVTCHTGTPEPPGAPVIHLIPAAGWWFARWQHTPTPHVAIDICTPCEFSDEVWSYFDLELDLLRFRDGSWRLDDEDEFAAEVSAGRISTEERQAAAATVDALAHRLDRGDELFDRIGWDRLDRYAQEDFAPLTHVR